MKIILKKFQPDKTQMYLINNRLNKIIKSKRKKRNKAVINNLNRIIKIKIENNKRSLVVVTKSFHKIKDQLSR